MNILITGATGFIGRNLVRTLSKEHVPHILVRPESEWSDLGVEHAVIFSGDINHLAYYLNDNHIDGIVHLASLYVAEHKSEQIIDIINSNVFLGTAILEACKIAGTKWFLNTGTIWQNFNSPDGSDEYHPVNLYAASKQAFMTMAQYYIETSDIRFCTLKLCDTFGPDDTRRKIFSLFENVSKSGAILDMSPGEQLIDILHIDDVVAGFTRVITLLHNGTNSRNEYVLSSGNPKSLRELAEIYAFNHQTRMDIKWGGRPYRQREVMKPYIGYTPEGWKPLNIRHLIKQTGGG